MWVQTCCLVILTYTVHRLQQCPVCPVVTVCSMISENGWPELVEEPLIWFIDPRKKTTLSDLAPRKSKTICTWLFNVEEIKNMTQFTAQTHDFLVTSLPLYSLRYMCIGRGRRWFRRERELFVLNPVQPKKRYPTEGFFSCFSHTSRQSVLFLKISPVFLQAES